MKFKKILIYVLFTLALIWGANWVKESSELLGYEVFNIPVKVRVVGLPICGRSNIIEVEYENKTHDISVNKNDCIQGRYSIGEVLSATYNTKTREINPRNFKGSYRLGVGFLVTLILVFLLYTYASKKRNRYT